MVNWYSDNKEELKKKIKSYLTSTKEIEKVKVHGLIVPHAGYIYSGMVAGKAYFYLQNQKYKKIIVFGPSHYTYFYGIRTLKKIKTPLGEVKIPENYLGKLDYEHSVENQIPFLQYLHINNILPIVVGDISYEDAKEIAKEFNKKDTLFIFSTDLSHFLPYNECVKTDKETIKIIESLNMQKFEKIDACGKNGLKILFALCKENKWKPKLIEYKNSGDITRDKSSVVGYASFWF